MKALSTLDRYVLASWVRIFVGGLVDGVEQTLRVTLGRFRAETTWKENR